MYVNVGAPGRCHDSTIYEKSKLKHYHDGAEVLQHYRRTIGNVSVPVVIIGDSAFRFSENLMKPFPYSLDLSNEQKNFNKALSKCRRVVENAFGHLKARFRRLGKGLENNMRNVNKIIKACCVLHNFLSKENDPVTQSWLDEESAIRSREQPSQHTRLGNLDATARRIRESISQYLGNYIQALFFTYSLIIHSFIYLLFLHFNCTTAFLEYLVFFGINNSFECPTAFLEYLLFFGS